MSTAAAQSPSACLEQIVRSAITRDPTHRRERSMGEALGDDEYMCDIHRGTAGFGFNIKGLSRRAARDRPNSLALRLRGQPCACAWLCDGGAMLKK